MEVLMEMNQVPPADIFAVAGRGYGMETFADVVNRLLPRSISLAKMSRLADIDYSYMHGLMNGGRKGKVLRPTPEKGLRVLAALEKLGVTVTEQNRMAMMEACVDLPQGFHVTEAPPNMIRSLDPSALRVAEAYRGAPQEVRAVFDALAGSVGRKSSEGERSPEEVASDLERDGAHGRQGG